MGPKVDRGGHDQRGRLDGHELCARALLEKGDDKEAVQNQGLTALMFSCQNGHEQCTRALMCSVFLCSGS